MVIQSKKLPGPTCHTSPSPVSLSLHGRTLSPVHALRQAAGETEVDRVAGDAARGRLGGNTAPPTTLAPSRSSPLLPPRPATLPTPTRHRRCQRERGGGEEGKRRKRRWNPTAHVSTSCRPSSGFGEVGYGSRHSSGEAGCSPPTKVSSPPLPSLPRVHSQPRPLLIARRRSGPPPARACRQPHPPSRARSRSPQSPTAQRENFVGA